MLAHDFAQYEAEFGAPLDVRGWWMSEKLDGWRVLFDCGTRTLYTREGVKLKAPRWWRMSIPKALPSSLVIDGELWIDRGHTCDDVARAVHRGDWRALRFMAFDINLDFETTEGRAQWLDDLLRAAFYMQSTGVCGAVLGGEERIPTDSIIQCVTHTQCEGIDDLRQFYDAVTLAGGEGIMLRKPGSLYECGRSWNLVKVKERP